VFQLPLEIAQDMHIFGDRERMAEDPDVRTDGRQSFWGRSTFVLDDFRLLDGWSNPKRPFR
jgi:hypothetical protein